MNTIREIIRKIKYVFRSIKEIEQNGKHWDGGVARKLDMLWCMLRYGASPRNYYWFGFYELDAKHRKTFVTHKLSEKMQRINNDIEYVAEFDNKYNLDMNFSKFMRRKVFLNTECSADNITELGEKFIYKPINGSQAQGIEVFNAKDYTQQQLLERVRSLPTGVLEEWIVQHEVLNQFNKKAVNIVRVVTARKTEKFAYLAATLAVANEKEYTNASANAMFANIDLNTGIIISDACDYEENIYERHPESGVKFKGFQIPYWDETLEMVKEASKIIPQMGYIGWDIAITPEGPVIVEGNDSPGYEWMQVRMINPSGYGKRAQYEQFM